MRRGRSEGRSFAASVERGLHLAIGLVIVVKTVVWAGQFALRPSYDGEDLTFAAVLVCSVGLAAINCLRGRASSVDVVLCTIAMVAGSLMHRDSVPLSGSADSPIIHLAEPMLMVIAARRRGPVVSMALIAALFVTLRWVTGGEDGLLYGLQEAALIGGTVFGALFLVSQMRGASVRAERTLATRRVVEAERMSSAEVEATSFLHDELIPTLLAVAGLPGDPDTWSAAAIALEEIEVPAGEQGLGDLVADIRTAAGREQLDAQIVVRGRRQRLPDVVQDALLGAATEALRNVARHSGQRRVLVTVVRRLGSIRIEVADQGEGFIAEHGVGLRVAVAGRVSAVGGTTRVDSVPGSGTTVSLMWRYRRFARLFGMSPDHDRVIRAVVRDPGRVALQACVVLAVGYLATAALLTLDNPLQPESYLGATAIAALVVLLTMAMTRGPLTPAHLFLAAMIPPAVLAAALPVLPSAGLGGAQSWLIEFSALPALAVAWVVSLRTTLLVLVPNALVITGVALQLDRPASDLAHLLFVQPLNALFVGLIVSVCRRAGNMVTNRAVAQASDRRVALERLLGNFLAPVQEILLRGALGQLTTSESTRAALLAHAARDCLYLPGAEHADLRAELTALRAAGAQVENRMTEYPAATRTLASALRALVGTHAVQVTISGNVDESSVVVVPGLGIDAAARVTRSLPISWQARAEPEAMVLTGPPDLASVIRRGGRRLVRD
ncbi:ATP-binding protein [Nocardioides sp. WS12]|uniref:sensor histidine kinase n=1 Tax=Nocardioides sp. WS12 TaxID=2486272 RepID=UPI0015F8BD9A|nr:ATP-binding protein [Nocardioides sp. WS12]